MNSSILTPLHALLSPARPPTTTVLSQTAGSSASWLASHVSRETGRPVVLVTGRTDRAEALYRELLFFTRHWERPPVLLPFPAWETLPFEPLSPFGPLVGERIATLFRLTQILGMGPVTTEEEVGSGRTILITTPMAMTQRLMPRQWLARHGFAVAMRDRLDLDAFRQFLAISGYRAVSQVSEPGEFAVRGGIVDFFPPGRDDPVRIELFGEEVETLRLFDPLTQRSTDRIPFLQVLPASEVILSDTTISNFRTNYRSLFGGAAADDEQYKMVSKGQKPQGMEQYLPLFYETTDTLFDYLGDNAVFLLEDSVAEAADDREREIQERYALINQTDSDFRCLPPDRMYLAVSEMQQHLDAHSVLRLAGEGTPLANSIPMGFRPAPQVKIQRDKNKSPALLEGMSNILNEMSHAGFRTCLVVRTVGQMERLREMLEDYRLPCTNVPDWGAMLNQPAGVVRLAVGDVIQGFVHDGMKLAVLTEEDLFGARVRRRRLDRKYLDQLIASFADLAEGDLVVHVDHGIGRYGGLHTLQVGVVRNDFLLIIYADEDKLYVPVENLDQVSKYTGGEEVQLDKLGSNRWERTKERAKKRIMEMAAELVAIQAKRETALGTAFSGPDALYEEFAATFPFEETPDQAHAITTVLEDMASPRPMDRLVCGDVGFGKTEVALRATFRAVMDGKQVAILTPTTILAQQHFDTFTKRLQPYPVRVELLSRFRTAAELKKSVEAARLGFADVIIGTHRLLQKDVAFKDLGLLVVDEEQRFGVTHKEKIKQLRTTVDILTLTATPIPRTLHLAMAGVRDISIIATPPNDRLAIRTVVVQFDRQQIREAILREIYRGGQVFYVYNRVQDIDKIAATLNELVPEAKVGVAHGQMPESQLERVMMSFYRQEFNLLLCTTIIENGVDIPTANTIIIHRADKFGLGQLHQLRGRVGRSKHRAYAYFLIPPPQHLSDVAQRRLEAISLLGDLGAGFLLASRDLEIRGAGNILGDEQSGQIREVGFELYNQMLAEAVAEIKRQTPDLQVESSPNPVKPDGAPQISLNLSIHIPDHYVGDVHQRLTLYKRIADLTSLEEISDMRVELTDRFGLLPQSVDHLLRVMKMKQICRQMKISKLEAGPKGGSIQFHLEPMVDPVAIFTMVRSGGGLVRFAQDTRTLSFRNQPWEDPVQRLEALSHILTKLTPGS